MIKIQNNTATREPIPSFLIGLLPESLIDLSWTDEQLGVQDCVWWQETYDDAPINHETHKYGAEILTPNFETQTVSVTHEIIAFSQDELNAITESKKQAQKVQIEQSLIDFAKQRDFDLNETDKMLNSGVQAWIDEAYTFNSLWAQTWQAFYNNTPLPELSWL